MVKYPFMRKELIDTLRKLADRDYQDRVWIRQDFPEPIKYDCFDYAVHFLFDDTPLAEEPEKAIGAILKNEMEARAVQQVVRAIDMVLNTLGTEACDKEYINWPGWQNVIETASTALKLFEPETN